MRRVLILIVAGGLGLGLLAPVALAGWDTQVSGVTTALYGIAALDAQHAVAVGATGTIIRTENGGQLWLPVPSGVTATLMGTFFVDANHGWACGSGGSILATTNGGETWSSQPSGVTQYLYYVHFVDTLNGWACGQNGFVLHTTNGGQSWLVQPTGSTMALWSIRFANNLVGWTVGQSGTILKTTNGGETWNPQISGTTTYLQSVFCVGPDTVYAVGGNGTILRSYNGGETWLPCITGTTNWFYQAFFTSATHGWAVARYGLIMCTADAGENWSTQYNPGTSTLVLRGVSFTNGQIGWVSGTGGTVLYTDNGGVPSPLAVTLTPVNPPIQIPAAGGSFNYDVQINNISDSTVVYDAWISAVLPSGTAYPILSRTGLTLAAGDSLMRSLTQAIPPAAPAGLYSYCAFVGDYPDMVWDQSQFTFEKLTGDRGGAAGSWNLTGWEETVAAPQPETHVLLSAHPNPFNPATTLSYQLPTLSRVSLNIYDTAGREVAMLVNGWREAGSHEVTFDGSGLASGLYLYRLEAAGQATCGKMLLLK
ncbi:MAG: T9SS C-terminal target domain-containing protein [Candidatus Zixiibacteriota bacterium]|nr:MAG: T9SS C-terminal target domain-containing protein [candidate division Zixibacteria bacterium]